MVDGVGECGDSNDLNDQNGQYLLRVSGGNISIAHSQKSGAREVYRVNVLGDPVRIDEPIYFGQPAVRGVNGGNSKQADSLI